MGGKSTAFTHYAVFWQTDLRALAIVYKPVPHTAMGERERVCQLNMLGSGDSLIDEMPPSPCL